MPRPFKARRMARLPGVTVFKPAGISARELTQVEVHLDELESIRLVDGGGLDHAEAAERMKVSHPTVSRILSRVRKKIAQALVEGEALFIEQGDAPVEHVGEAKRHRKRRQKKAYETETIKTEGRRS